MVEIKEITGSQTWPIRKEVMYPGYSIDFVKLPEDQNGTHFGLFYNNELVSVVSLFIEEGIAQFRKLATKVSFQGKGFGSQLLSHILEFSNQLNCSEIWCNARQEKCAFYRKFGMTEADKIFNRENITYVIMSKRINT